MATDIAEVYGPIERAHRKFSVGALQRLYPELQGPALARAIAREMLRDAAYLENARRRLTEAVAAANQLPGPTRREKLDQARRAEARYLQMHIEAAGHRMMREAEAARIFETEDEAYWQLGDRKTHTPDCLRMAGRIWKRDVLEVFNPANRHAGCGCRLRRVSEARAEGLPIKRGVMTAKARVVMQEGRQSGRARLGLTAPTMPGKKKRTSTMPRLTQSGFKGVTIPKFGAGAKWNPALHPKDAKGRFRRVYGSIPKALEPKFKKLQDAIAKGDLKTVQKLNRELIDAAGKMGDEGRKAQKTLRRVERKVINPRNTATTYGKPVGVGKPARAGDPPPNEVPAPLASYDDEIYDPWSEDGNYAWLLPDAPTTRTLIDNVRRSWVAEDGQRPWRVSRVGDNWRLEPNPELPEVERRAMARQAEITLPQFRTIRAQTDTSLSDDDRPLGIGFGETVLTDSIVTPGGEKGGSVSVFPGVTNNQLGVAGEMGINDVVASLKQLGLMREDDDRVYMPEADPNDPNPYAPLDWLINGWGIEVKTTGLRNFNFDTLNDSKAVDSEQGPRKRAAALTGNWMKRDAVAGWKGTPKQERRVLELVGTKKKPGLIDAARKAGDHKRAEKLWAELVRMGAYREKPQTFKGKAREIFDSARGRERIQDQAIAQGLKPAIVQNLIDLDNDVQHVFFYEYADEETAFRSAPRIPVGMTRELADGTLKPGDFRSPQGGSQQGPEYRTIYVGAFPLRLNPYKQGDIALDAPELRAIDKGERDPLRGGSGFADRMAAGPRRADTGVSKTVPSVPELRAADGKPASTPPKGKRKVKTKPAKPAKRNNRRSGGPSLRLEDLSPRDRQLIDLHNQGVPQGEIASQLNYAGNGPVSARLKYLRGKLIDADKIIKPSAGRGARTDIASQKKQGVAAPATGAEMRRWAAGVKKLWGAPRNTEPTKRKPSIAAVMKELGITREQARAALEQATLDLEQKGVIRQR